MSWKRRNYRRSRDDEDESENRESEGSWDDFDSLFDFDFRSSFRNIDQLIERMFSAAKANADHEEATLGPVYYGYSIITGPDGKPHVRQFGNIKPTTKGTFERSSREPFVDTVLDEKENKLKIIAEMPGVEREDIKLEVLENSLKIRAQHGDRDYETTVPLQAAIEPSTASATYNNGVLEVNMKLREQAKPKGYTVKVN